MNNEDTNPLVSVLMTAYNREKYIAEAIESVLASSYKNFELIIVDDCSADNTVEIARQYEQKDSRIQLYVNDHNLQQFTNRNRAAGFARGEYLVWVDSDDTILPDGFEKLVQTMKSFPRSSFGMYWYQPTSSVPILRESQEAIRSHFFERPILGIGPGGTILKRSFFLSLGGYTDDYNAAGDMFFNLKACCYSPLVQFPFEFMVYRRHDLQEINNPYQYLYNSYLYLRDALANLPLPLEKSELAWLRKKNSRRFLANITNYFIKTKNLSLTKKALDKANFGFKQLFEAVFH